MSYTSSSGARAFGRRSLAMIAAVTFAFGLGACSDDDGGSGLPDACDNIDLSGAPGGLSEDDLRTISYGSSRSGSLSTSDLQDAGYYFDVWVFSIGSSREVRIDLESDQFDAWLVLINESGTTVDFDDDGGDGFNSRIVADLTSGCYGVVVTSYGEGGTGSYTLRVRNN